MDILSDLFAEFSNIQFSGSNASYIATCVESVIPQSSPNVLSELSADNLTLLLDAGYIVQSTIISQNVLNWIDESPDVLQQFVNLIPSCSFMKNSSFTPFEANILLPLAIRFDILVDAICQKLTLSIIDLGFVKTALDLATMLRSMGCRENRSIKLITSALQLAFSRCEAVVAHIFDDDDISDQSWEIVAGFVLHSNDIDAEKWLGRVCKHDMEDLNPKASKAINNIMRKDPTAFHRLLPRWLYRTCSRFTRRFAEDPILSELTVSSVASFSMSPF